MEALLAQLESLDERAADLLATHAASDHLLRTGDDELLRLLAVTARIQRRLDAVMVDAVGEASARSRSVLVDDRLTSRMGCHDVSELVQRTTLLAPASAGRLIRAAKAVCGERALVTGERLEAPLPALREAMLRGGAGVDGVLAISTPLLATGARPGRDALAAADDALAAAALGEGEDAAPPACADLLRVQALAWQSALDQDGAEPRDRRMMHRRSFTLGTATEWGVPASGMLMPEVAAQMQRLFDALLSPRSGGVRFTGDGDGDGVDETEDAPADIRTRAQRQHDALATVLTVAARSGDMPTIGGAAPTLVVSARHDDLVHDTGSAHLDGYAEPVSMATARHIACGSVIQRVALDDTGRIRRLGTEERVFNRHQRRAITLRDGGCIIPGCAVPASWCEIHHVQEHAHGGPTHTDNGVLLCWFHHRFLETSGWQVRMNRGVPEVKAPPWWDSDARWRPVTRSPIRLSTAIRRT